MRNYFIALILFITAELQSQVIIGLSGNVGYSLAEQKNLTYTTLATSCRLRIEQKLSSHSHLTVGYNLTRLGTKLDLINRFFINDLSNGFTFIPAFTQKKIEINTSAIFSWIRMRVSSEKVQWNNNYHSLSTWTQWGYSADIKYILNNHWGISLGYTRYCARSVDPDNYQSIVHTGIVYRLSTQP